MTKKFIITIVVVLLVGLAAGLIIKKYSQPAVKVASNAANPGPVSITNVPNTILPDRFPTDVPVEAGADIVYNYNAINAAGHFQSSREFISKKTEDQNYVYYQQTLAAAGWTITQAINDGVKNQRIILANKGANSLNIIINTQDGQVHVSVNNESKP